MRPRLSWGESNFTLIFNALHVPLVKPTTMFNFTSVPKRAKFPRGQLLLTVITKLLRCFKAPKVPPGGRLALLSRRFAHAPGRPVLGLNSTEALTSHDHAHFTSLGKRVRANCSSISRYIPWRTPPPLLARAVLGPVDSRVGLSSHRVK